MKKLWMVLSLVMGLLISTTAFSTFVLTKYQAYGVNISSATKKRAIQYAVFYITAANTDVDLDIGDDSGTFWTAVTTGTTYGDVGDGALASIQRIDDRVDALRNIHGLEAYKFDNMYNYCDTAASTGGDMSEALTCSGLLSTDTVMSVTQQTRGASNTALTAWDEPITSGSIHLYWTADTYGGAISRVFYRRDSSGSEYMCSVAVEDYRPNITFLSGDAPTSLVLILEWELSNENYVETAAFGS